jgi:hypothetical protein
MAAEKTLLSTGTGEHAFGLRHALARHRCPSHPARRRYHYRSGDRHRLQVAFRTGLLS